MKEYKILFSVIIVSLIISAPLVQASWTGKFWEWLGGLFGYSEEPDYTCCGVGYDDTCGYPKWDSGWKKCVTVKCKCKEGVNCMDIKPTECNKYPYPSVCYYLNSNIEQSDCTPTTTTPPTTQLTCSQSSGSCISEVDCIGHCQNIDKIIDVTNSGEDENCASGFCCVCKESTPTTAPPTAPPTTCTKDQCSYDNRCYSKGERKSVYYAQYICDGNEIKKCNSESINDKISIIYATKETINYICCDLGDEKGKDRYQWHQDSCPTTPTTAPPTTEKCYDNDMYNIDVGDDGVSIGTTICGNFGDKYAVFKCTESNIEGFGPYWIRDGNWCPTCENAKCIWKCSDCGWGTWNICDESECKSIGNNIGGCYYAYEGTRCRSCIGIERCEQYPNNINNKEMICENDDCSVGPCEWNQKNDKCEESITKSTYPFNPEIPENPTKGDTTGFVVEGCEASLTILLNQKNDVLNNPIISTRDAILFTPETSGNIRYICICFDEDTPQIKKGTIDVSE